MSLSYIKRAEQGNHSALSFVGSVMLSLGAVMLAAMPLYTAIILKNLITNSDKPIGTTMDQLMGHFSYPLAYTFLMLGFVFITLMVIFFIRVIHRRKFGTIWSDEDKFRPKEFLKGLVFSVMLFSLSDVIINYNTPGYFTWVFNPDRFWPYLPLAIIFIPIQTLAEELVFRGHFYQAFGLATKNKWVSLVICSVIFGALHFTNSEMGIDAWKVGTVYIGSGFLIGFTVLISKGIEFGWAFHLINNLYLSTIVTFPGSSLDGPTLYVKPKPSADWILTEFLVEVIILVLVVCVIYRKNLKSLFKETT